MKYAIIFALSLFLFPRTALAQTCYVRLTDASGYTPTTGQLDTLEQAAAALCAVFDSAGFGGQFKVYDFGFYLHHETTTGGYPEPFARKVEEVAVLSPYYLLFGREANNQGTSQRFWVEAGLPDSGIFYCINQLSPALRANLSKKYGIIANEIHRLGAERPENKFHLAEIGAMDSLRTYIFDLMICCDGEQRAATPSCNACVFTYSQISQNLVDAGFATTTPLTPFGTKTSTGISASIDGRTHLILDIAGDSVELDKHASGIAERYMENNPGNTIKIFLRKFSDVCVNLEATLDQFRADNSDAKVLMAAIPDDGGNKIRLHFLSEGDLRVDNVSADDFIKGYPDHYFNLEGTYLGQDTGGWARIRVINKPLSEVPNLMKDVSEKIVNKAVGELNSVNLQKHVLFEYTQNRNPGAMFSTIGKHYATSISVFYKIKIDTTTKNTAWSSILNKIIYIRDSQIIHGGYDFYNQFKSIIYHESVHIDTKKGQDEDPCGHVEPVYISQIKHPTFALCSEKFRLQILGLCACYILACRKWHKNTDTMTARINKEIKEYGYYIKTDSTYCYVHRIKDDIIVYWSECKDILNSSK